MLDWFCFHWDKFFSLAVRLWHSYLTTVLASALLSFSLSTFFGLLTPRQSYLWAQWGTGAGSRLEINIFCPRRISSPSTSPCVVNAVSVTEQAAFGRGARASFGREQAPLKQTWNHILRLPREHQVMFSDTHLVIWVLYLKPVLRQEKKKKKFLHAEIGDKLMHMICVNDQNRLLSF